MYLVQVLGEDGPPGVMHLWVLAPEDAVDIWAECDHTPLAGEVVGAFYDGYNAGGLFCHRCLVTVGEATDIRLFATEEAAWEFVHTFTGPWAPDATQEA